MLAEAESRRDGGDPTLPLSCSSSSACSLLSARRSEGGHPLSAKHSINLLALNTRPGSLCLSACYAARPHRQGRPGAIGARCRSNWVQAVLELTGGQPCFPSEEPLTAMVTECGPGRLICGGSIPSFHAAMMRSWKMSRWFSGGLDELKFAKSLRGNQRSERQQDTQGIQCFTHRVLSFRIICATHQDRLQRDGDGSFVADLAIFAP